MKSTNKGRYATSTNPYAAFEANAGSLVFVVVSCMGLGPIIPIAEAFFVGIATGMKLSSFLEQVLFA